MGRKGIYLTSRLRFSKHDYEFSEVLAVVIDYFSKDLLI